MSSPRDRSSTAPRGLKWSASSSPTTIEIGSALVAEAQEPSTPSRQEQEAEGTLIKGHRSKHIAQADGDALANRDRNIYGGCIGCEARSSRDRTPEATRSRIHMAHCVDRAAEGCEVKLYETFVHKGYIKASMGNSEAMARGSHENLLSLCISCHTDFDHGSSQGSYGHSPYLLLVPRYLDELLAAEVEWDGRGSYRKSLQAYAESERNAHGPNLFKLSMTVTVYITGQRTNDHAEPIEIRDILIGEGQDEFLISPAALCLKFLSQWSSSLELQKLRGVGPLDIGSQTTPNPTNNEDSHWLKKRADLVKVHDKVTKLLKAYQARDMVADAQGGA